MDYIKKYDKIIEELDIKNKGIKYLNEKSSNFNLTLFIKEVFDGFKIEESDQKILVKVCINNLHELITSIFKGYNIVLDDNIKSLHDLISYYDNKYDINYNFTSDEILKEYIMIILMFNNIDTSNLTSNIKQMESMEPVYKSDLLVTFSDMYLPEETIIKLESIIESILPINDVMCTLLLGKLVKIPYAKFNKCSNWKDVMFKIKYLIF